LTSYRSFQIINEEKRVGALVSLNIHHVAFQPQSQTLGALDTLTIHR